VLGVYGVVSYSVSQRTHEIGVLIAVGASRGSVVRLILGDGLRLALQAAALGLVGAVLMTRSLARLLHGVGAFDPPTLLGCASVLVLVALVASAAPAWRGTRVDPVVALRSDQRPVAGNPGRSVPADRCSYRSPAPSSKLSPP
jgi:putative ABC transport system permease protein